MPRWADEAEKHRALNEWIARVRHYNAKELRWEISGVELAASGYKGMIEYLLNRGWQFCPDADILIYDRGF